MTRYPTSVRLLGCLLAATIPVASYALSPDARFSSATYRAHIEFLASDAQAGRGLGDEGIERSAEYIAGKFREIGLGPAGDDGTFFQSFGVKLGGELTGEGLFEISGVEGAPVQSVDYVPFPFSSSGDVEGDVVFAGYGIVNPDKGHDDYTHLDVTGKVVLMLRREPPGWAESGGYTAHAEFSNKVYTAKEHGAAGVLIVNNRTDDDEDPDQLFAWAVAGMAGGAADYGLPAFHVKQALAARMIAAGGLPGLEKLQADIDAGGFASGPLQGVRVKARAPIERRQVATRNVLGKLPGTGPLASEIVVIGAHYDHLGRTIPRTTLAESQPAASPEPQIHNGADDNASGVAGVIELARAFARAGEPKRTIVFMAFSGEESGLLGSAHFVDHPTFDLSAVVAMLNLDMIGRLPPHSDKIQVFGTKAADEFEPLLTRLAEKHGFKLEGSASAFGPSDHTSFYKKDIPALHFFTGLHGDYHLPGDDVEKINADGASAVLGLVFDAADEIIAAQARPTYHKVDAPAQIGRSSYRVRMGIMPSYADQADGMAVDAVVAGGPAEQAGMKGGDVIVRIGETKVATIHDYMAALRKNNPGDTVEVVVRRDGAELTLSVKLVGG